MQVWFYFWLLTFLAPFLVAIFSVIALRFTLDRRVRRSLPSDKFYDSYMDAYGGVGRAVSFGYACAFKYFNNSPRIRDNYDNIDIQEFANPLERAIGISLSYSVILCAASVLISGVLDLVGIIDLD